MAPYKAPERNLEENEIFNKHVSKLRIRSEHAIGYLKGHFQSLKGLRVLINSSDAHIIAMYWVAACIGIHSFALKHEIQQRQEQDPDFDDNNPYSDPFIYEGISDSEDEDDSQEQGENRTSTSQISVRLRHGKVHQEKMKKWLFQAKEHHRQARLHSRRAALQAELSTSPSISESTSENLSE